MSRKYSKEQREKMRERGRLMGLSQKGEKSPSWVGDKVGYRSLHNWVQSRLGKPHLCTECGRDDLQHRQYHWANISGKYRRDLTDWVRLCAKCHLLFDKVVHGKRAHRSPRGFFITNPHQ